METKSKGGDQNHELVILKHALENTNEAFVTIDEDRRILFFNEAAEKIFGYSRDDVLGQKLDVITVPSCSQSHREAIRRHVATGIPVRVGHKTGLLATRKNGEKFPISISLSVTEVDGKLFFTGIVTDMTETRVLQEKVTQSEHLAALGQLVAEITHEIKNPLVMIGGFAQQLFRPIDDETKVKKLTMITEQVKRLEELLAELREFYVSKTPTIEAVNIKEVLEKIYSLVKDECAKKNIRTELKIDENAFLVNGDAGKLQQVFLNLVKNSIEAMENGGNLSIRTKVAGDEVDITVNDDGCGIPNEHMDKILECFFTSKSYGTGLGLCISKKFIDEHEGSSLSVRSEEGRGTTVNVILPLHHGRPEH